MSSVNYNRTEKLRFWCQKVLPIVYDDSLSYYELLNKVVVYLNSTIEDVQSVIDEMTTLEQSVGNKIDKTQKGVANGVATLDGTGKVPLSQLPDVSAGVQTISVNGVNVPADANRNVNIIVMTNSVSNLVNYYLKSETYNKSEVNTLIDNVKNSRFEVVAELPTSDIQTNVIYLVPKVDSGVQNGYDEYINLDGTTSGWELIGSTDIDLSGYVTDSELATALTSYVTTQALNATLTDYVSNSALATALSGYVQMSMFNALSGVVSQQGEALEDRVDIFAVTQSRETGDTATTLHNVNTFVWVDKLTNIFGSHLFKVTQTVNVGDNWASIKSSKLSDVTVSGELRDIEGKIPATASASNKLATAEDITATVDLLKDTTGWVSKNKNVYPYQQASKTSGSLSVTANTDSSIEANGTNDTGGYVDFAMQSRTGVPNAMWLPKGRYIVSVDYEGEYTGAYAYVGNTYNGAYHVLIDRIPFGKDGKLLVIDENVQADSQYKKADGSCLVAFYLGFPNGSTATNLKLYPMICDEKTYKLSPSFEPPHESVAEMITYRSKTYSIRETVLNGFITTGSAEIHIFIAGRFDNITNVSIAPTTTWIRGIKGYLKDENGVDISGGTYSFADNLKVNQVVKSDFGLKVVIKNKNDGTFTNVDNNTPISVLFGGSGSITLS